MREKWRLILDPPLDGAHNMAVDKAILTMANKGLAPPTLRLYSWSCPTLSIGYAQNIKSGFNLEYIQREQIPIVRRPTGGRALLHENELTYAVIMPSSSKRYGSLSEVYKFVADAIVYSLKNLGLNVDSGRPRTATFGSASCFSSQTRHELSHNGFKIVGSAQRRLKGAVLQHGSIVFHVDKERYLSCFDWPDELARQTGGEKLGGLDEASGGVIEHNLLKGSLIHAFAHLYDINGKINKLTRKEKELVDIYKLENQNIKGDM